MPSAAIDHVGLGAGAVGECDARLSPCCSKPMAVAGVHRPRRAGGWRGNRRSRRGACRRSRSSRRNPSPAPGRSACRRRGNSASRADPRAPFLDGGPEPHPLELAHAVRSEIDAGADFAQRGRLLVDRHARPCAISALAANRPPIPPPTITTLVRLRHRHLASRRLFDGIFSDVISATRLQSCRTEGVGKRHGTGRSSCALLSREGAVLPAGWRSLLAAAALNIARPTRSAQTIRIVRSRSSCRSRPAAPPTRCRACGRLALAQMGPAGRDREPHRRCRKYRRRAVYRSEPDGYTLLSAPPPPLVINQNLYPKLGYDPTSSSRSS